MKIDPFAAIDEEPISAIPDVLRHKPSHAKRNRDWEREQRDAGTVVTYRAIPASLSAAIRDIADGLSVPVSEVARALLETGLREYKAGSLTLAPKFTGKLSLYGDKN